MQKPYPITAFGLCCGLGRSADEAIAQLRAGQRGLRACPFEVPFETLTGTLPGPLPDLRPELLPYDSRLTRLTQLGFEDIEGPVLAAVERWGAARVALVVGTSTGGIHATELAHAEFQSTETLPEPFDYHRQHPFHIFSDTLQILSGAEGPRYIVSTACSSSAKVLASAQRLLDVGLADAVLVGGGDGLCHTTVRGFHSLGVMAPRECRPFGAERPGMNVGEGVALLLLEREGEGRATLLGVGESSDAYHPSSPHPEGRGAIKAMRAALAMGGISASDVDYVNAHGTGTKYNDIAEGRALGVVFERPVPVVSTKSYTGHTLGACGALEAIFGIVALEQGFIPANLGLDPRDPEIDLLLPTEPIEGDVHYVLSNAFAFGGNNSSVLLGRAR